MKWFKKTAGLLAGLVLLVLVVRLIGAFYATSRLANARQDLEQVVGSLDLATLAPPPVGASENAARSIESAAAALERPTAEGAALHEPLPETLRLVALNAKSFGELQAFELAEARTLVSQLPLDPADLERVSSLEQSNFGIDYERGTAAVMPDLLRLLRLTHVVSMSARLGIQSDAQELILASGAISGLARAVCNEPTLVTHLVGGAIERMHHRILAEYLQHGQWSVAVVEELTGQLEATDCGATIDRAVRAEALLEASFPDGDFVPDPGLFRLQRWFLAPLEDLQFAALLEGRRRTLESLGESFAAYEALHNAGVFRPDRFAMIYDMVAPNLVDAVGKARATQVSRALGGLALNAARVRLRSGDFPSQWPDLLSVYSGGPLRVARQEGGGLAISDPQGVERYRATGGSPPILEWLVPQPAELDAGAS